VDREEPSRPWSTSTNGAEGSRSAKSRSTKSPSGSSTRSRCRAATPARDRSSRAPRVWAWGPGSHQAGWKGLVTEDQDNRAGARGAGPFSIE